jgi:hypothetical protein
VCLLGNPCTTQVAAVRKIFILFFMFYCTDFSFFFITSRRDVLSNVEISQSEVPQVLHLGFGLGFLENRNRNFGLGSPNEKTETEKNP